MGKSIKKRGQKILGKFFVFSAKASEEGKEHIRENLDLFGFELSDEEMEQIATLDRGEKHDWY